MENLTIKQIRVGMNMTQSEMAEMLGMCTRTYQKKELGKVKFTFDEVREICLKAGVSLDHVK